MHCVNSVKIMGAFLAACLFASVWIATNPVDAHPSTQPAQVSNVPSSANSNNEADDNNENGAPSDLSVPTAIPMDENNSGTAINAGDECFTIYMNSTPLGAGYFTTTPLPNCAYYLFSSGSTVTLTAVANEGYTFLSWGGDASGTSPTTSIVVDGTKNVTVNFKSTQPCFSLDSAVSPINAGIIKQTPLPNCTTTLYITGTVVTLSVVPNPGFGLLTWSGDANGSANPLSITLDGPKSLRANLIDLVSTHRIAYLPLVLNIPPLKNADFELGDTGWEQYSSHNWQLILDASALPLAPHSGNWAVWLGGDYNEHSSVSQQIYINPSTPYLSFWRLIASEEAGCKQDLGLVAINGITKQTLDICKSSNTDTWVNQIVDLSAYAGKSVELKFELWTDSQVNSNLFIDDVSLQPNSYVTASGVENIETLSRSGRLSKDEFLKGKTTK